MLIGCLKQLEIHIVSYKLKRQKSDGEEEYEKKMNAKRHNRLLNRINCVLHVCIWPRMKCPTQWKIDCYFLFLSKSNEKNMSRNIQSTNDSLSKFCWILRNRVKSYRYQQLNISVTEKFNFFFLLSPVTFLYRNQHLTIKCNHIPVAFQKQFSFIPFRFSLIISSSNEFKTFWKW